MHTLYQFQSSGNCYKLRLAMHQLGIPFHKVEVDILQKQSRTPEFLAMNPNGRIPVLKVGERYLPESNAALWYLAQGSALMPTDSFAQAQLLQWMFFEQYSHEPNIATIRYWVHIANTADQFEQEIEAKRKAGYAALRVMDTHLAGNPYLVAGQYSIADIALYAYTHVAAEGGFDLSSFTHIARWLSDIEAQPGYINMANS
ncbi:glutathione S-transferase family protein [Gilvimarinus sp. SDUM040013]|uniref:Glutathione S-transferase family protein n=1 Tax=Gilvimarinus gilvus TaxID=3058038 RepID=A0ABU4S562_9GAMM|nr:glutathione S-transferase family protein [Gilvimarinus sp. SDUM040013]MDO3384936.1 glutathione S-transferase family protein [Gilvimarinus sp. SDUM040013]MDX6851531.1 glutathione S-transferase family protein [Gilvimarinus sp. SDUM040013]